MAELLDGLVPLLGLALLHFLWQGALIGLLAAIVLDLMRNARPQARYAAACLALLACALAPVATLLYLLAPEMMATGFSEALATFGRDAEPAGDGALSVLVSSTARFHDWLPAIVATWAAGTCALSLRMALGLAWVRRLRNSPQGPAQPAWQARLDAIAEGFQLRRHVSLRLVDPLESPASTGWWRPVVLLPASLLTRMPTALIEALLAHELAHIRRHDYLVNLVQNAVEALLFYHPVVWWLSHRIRVEREQIADQLAAELACAPRELALALSELSELRAATPGAALRLVQAADGGQLMSRIQRLVRPTRRTHAGARVVFPLLGLAAAIVGTYSWAQARDDEAGTGTHGTFHLDRNWRGDSFALVRANDDSMYMWGSMDDIDEIKSARKGATGDYLWFKRDGRAYRVTDPAMIARATAVTHETDELDRQMEELEAQAEPHEQKLELLEKRMDALGDEMDSTPRAEAAERQMDKLSEQQEELGSRQEELAQRMEDAGDNQATIEQLAQQMEALAKQQHELGRQMNEQAKILDEESKALEARREPMEALARELEQASKPLEALSKQMEAQGRLLEQASARVEAELKKLIDEAVARKLATPVSSG
jgi:beta-lactamase regulating signal transducer with metallopeptidase domain/predicted  nucleic acid-binding Zn-ribbon protein